MQFLIAQWLQLFFSHKAVADRLQYMCDQGIKCMETSIIDLAWL